MKYLIENQYTDSQGFFGKLHTTGVDELGRPIVGKWIDGGDTLQREGAWAAGEVILSLLEYVSEADNPPRIRNWHYMDTLKYEYVRKLYILERKPGVYARHWDTDFWYADADRMSRDQMIPNWIAMGFLNLKSRLKRCLVAQLKRGFFMKNTRENGATKENHGQVLSNDKVRSYKWKVPDPCFFVTMGIYIRAFRNKWLYPVLLLADLQFLGNVLIFNRNKKDNDVINLVIIAAQNYFSMSTFISKYVHKIIDWDDMERRLELYFDMSEPQHIKKQWLDIVRILKERV